MNVSFWYQFEWIYIEKCNISILGLNTEIFGMNVSFCASHPIFVCKIRVVMKFQITTKTALKPKKPNKNQKKSHRNDTKPKSTQSEIKCTISFLSVYVSLYVCFLLYRCEYRVSCARLPIFHYTNRDEQRYLNVHSRLRNPSEKLWNVK